MTSACEKDVQKLCCGGGGGVPWQSVLFFTNSNLVTLCNECVSVYEHTLCLWCTDRMYVLCSGLLHSIFWVLVWWASCRVIWYDLRGTYIGVCVLLYCLLHELTILSVLMCLLCGSVVWLLTSRGISRIYYIGTPTFVCWNVTMIYCCILELYVFNVFVLVCQLATVSPECLRVCYYKIQFPL